MALAAALAGAAGCEKSDEQKEAAAPARVNAVAASAKKPVSAEEFCDARPQGGAAPMLSLPPLAAGSPPAPGSWRWINVWATWCKPCVIEMPLLMRWHKELAGEGMRYELVFLSVDENDELVAEFRKQHPAVPPSLRLAPESLPGWLAVIGLGEGAPIPVHVFVDPQDRVQCVRAGAVHERDLPAIREVLGS